jgi:hypothetical protein
VFGGGGRIRVGRMRCDYLAGGEGGHQETWLGSSIDEVCAF